jgi:branched-chain amino acid transport system permease protein
MCIAVLYRLTGIVHLAIGELAGITVFMTFWIAYGREAVAGTTARLPVVLAIGASLAVTALLGAIVFLVAVDPFVRRGFSVAWVGGVVAAAIALRGIVQVSFPRSSYTFAELLPLRSIGTDGVISLGGGATVQARAVVVGGVALLLAIAAGWLLEHSKYGTALRAISDDRLAAALCGVAVRKLVVAAFAVAALVVGGIAVLALSGEALTVNTTTLLGLKGLVAAVAARFGSPRRVVGVAILLGVIETSLATVHIGILELGPAYSDVVPIAIAILLLAAWGGRTALQERL